MSDNIIVRALTYPLRGRAFLRQNYRWIQLLNPVFRSELATEVGEDLSGGIFIGDKIGVVDGLEFSFDDSGNPEITVSDTYLKGLFPPAGQGAQTTLKLRSQFGAFLEAALIALQNTYGFYCKDYNAASGILQLVAVIEAHSRLPLKEMIETKIEELCLGREESGYEYVLEAFLVGFRLDLFKAGGNDALLCLHKGKDNLKITLL